MFTFLDTPFDPDLPIYTRSIAEEILPGPVTPLGWSLVGPAIEEAFRIAFCDDFSLLSRPGPDRRFQLVGRVAARLHLNLAVVRVAGPALPGTSGDLEYFADATASGLPAADAEDRRSRIKGTPALGRTLAGIGRRVNRDRAGVDAFAAEVTELLDGETDAATLIATTRRGVPLVAQALGTHLTCRGLAPPTIDQARGAAQRADVAAPDALRLLGHIDKLELTRPAHALAQLASSIPPGSRLAEIVAAGSLSALSASTVAGAAEVATAVQDFVDEFGHRGSSELDPVRPTWATQADTVLATLPAITADPFGAIEPPDIDPGRLARPLVAAARSAIARTARSEDTAARATHQLRRLVQEVRNRLHGDVHGVDDGVLFCTIDELDAIAHGGSAPAGVEIERRHREFEQAGEYCPALWSSGRARSHAEAAADLEPGGPVVGAAIEDVDRTEPATDGDAGPDEDGHAPPDATVTGAAGSPGIAEGRVRVVTDPGSDLEPGEIVVTRRTDVAWAPLLLSAGAVVTEIGGTLGHAATLARDLEIPAVVNTDGATRALRTGDLVRVDGSTGGVTVLDAP